MIAIPTLDELREVRRKLAEQEKFDVERYAEMLRKMAEVSSRTYLDKPLVPPGSRPSDVRTKTAGR